MTTEGVGYVMEMRWRALPLVPRRLRARAVGRDPEALTIYRPFRWHARLARPVRDRLLGHPLLPDAPPPAPEAEGLLAELRGSEGTLAAIASNRPGRWIVGHATAGVLEHVVKLNPEPDPGLRNEHAVLDQLDGGRPGWRTPRAFVRGAHSAIDAVVQEAVGVGARPVHDLGDAARLATLLVRDGWTHGDLNPWNAARDGRAGFVLVDWEWGRPGAEPLADLLYFAVVAGEYLGTLTPDEVVRALHDERSVFGRHLHEVDADPHEAPALARRLLPTIRGEKRFATDLLSLLDGTEQTRGGQLTPAPTPAR